MSERERPARHGLLRRLFGDGPDTDLAHRINQALGRERRGEDTPRHVWERR